MNHVRSLAPLLGLTALVAITICPSIRAHAQGYTVTVTDLTPSDPHKFNGAIGFGISGSHQAGYVRFYPASGDYTQAHQDAVVWTGSVDTLIDLAPAGFIGSQATGTSGSTQAGYGLTRDTGGNFIRHALLWQGTAASVVDLTPAGFNYAQANGVSGNMQVGVGGSTESGRDALLWTGTAASAVNLNPTNLSGFLRSEAVGISGGTQVGDGDYFVNSLGYTLQHALLWHGTADSAVDLNPAGYAQSFALGVSGTHQVGYAYTSGSDHAYALLWTGTAASAVVLDTPNLAGFDESIAYAVSGDVQVGLAGPYQNYDHAVLWRGTGASAIDLGRLIPGDYSFSSAAYGVEEHGNVVDVVGVGTSDPFSDDPISHAYLWHIVFADKPTVLHLDPASRTQGRDAFTLTVNGTGFTPSSVVQWNGAAQTTSFVSSTHVTASIPASLIANVGTAQVAMKTSGGVSNSRVLTIVPRPTLASLSPTSKKAGSAAFSLSVTGTGFRPASFYAPTVVKWNGTELVTTFVSPTQLTATVPTSLVKTAGTATVTVTTPEVATSAGKTFTVTP